MGCNCAKSTTAPEVTIKTKAEQRASRVAVNIRYHRLPRRVEDDYELQTTVLGTGCNGVVLKAYRNMGSKSRGGSAPSTSGSSYAVKFLKLRGINRAQVEEVQNEASLFLTMDHPHVARLLDVYEAVDKLTLVMECMGGGELFARLSKSKRFSEYDASRAVEQMLLAVNYLHSHGVVHRDLKLENFLYETEGSDHLKLIDFGFSKVWDPNTSMKQSCGTLDYVAPEVLAGSYCKQCDMWSLGVIAFILLFGYMPFRCPSEAETVRRIKECRWTKKEKEWRRVSPRAQEFVEKLLVINASKRMNAEEALAHPFIACDPRKVSRSNSLCEDTVSALQNFAKASLFRRACMAAMAWSLSAEEQGKVRDAFMAMDESMQGTITLSELRSALVESLGKEVDIEPIFKALDVAADEVVHYSEFLAAMVSTRIQVNDELLWHTFKRLDVDSSGYITVDNLCSVMGESFGGVSMEELIKEADFTKDGRISYEEFIRYINEGDGKDIIQIPEAERLKASPQPEENACADIKSRHASKTTVSSSALSCLPCLF